MTDNLSLATLPAVIKRAMALLDNGDLLAAKELSSKAYQDAKFAGQIGKRVAAADQLIRKAHQLQGDALLIESQARMRLVDEYDAAQQRGEMAGRGRPGKNVVGDDILTLDNFGLSRDEIYQARKLRDAENATPGIVQQAIAARLAQGLEPTKAAVNHQIGGGSGVGSEATNGGAKRPTAERVSAPKKPAKKSRGCRCTKPRLKQ